MMIWKWILRSLLTLIILLMILVCFMLTPYGFHFSLYLATKFAPGELHYQHASGMILGPASITGLDYKHDKQHIHINSLELNWAPSDLWHKQLTITHLNIEGVTAIMPTQPKPKIQVKTKEDLLDILKNMKPFEPKQFHLPFSVKINHAHITNIKYGITPNNITAVIKTIDINGTVLPNHIDLTATTEILEPRHITAKLTAKGSIKHYVIDVVLNDQLQQLTLHGEGNRDGAEITIPPSKMLDGTAEGKLKLTWYPQIQWDINLVTKEVDLGKIEEGLPAAISATLISKGKLEKTNPIFDLVININSGDSKVQLEAHHHKNWDGSWDINLPKITDFYPAAHGSIVLQGHIHGKNLFKPEITGTLKGKAIQFKQMDVENINGAWNIYLDNNKKSHLSVDANNIIFNKKKLDTLHLGMDGNLPKHTVKTKIVLGKHEITIAGDAHYDGNRWYGKLLEFTSLHNPFGNWKLRHPTTFEYSPTKAFLKPLCLDANTGAFLCTQGDWEQGKPWHFSLDSKKFSFTQLEKKAMIKTQITSKLSMQIKAEGNGKDIENATLHLDILPGMLTYIVDRQVINSPVRKSQVDLTINKNIGLQANVDLNFAENDSTKVKLNIPQFTDYSMPFKDKKLSGTVDILMHDFKFVSLIEDILKISLGRMTGHFTLGGTIGEPIYEGKAHLHIPNFEYTMIHVKAHDLNAEINVKNKKITYNLLGKALNNAPLTMDGETDLTEPHAVTKFTVKAKNAEVIHDNQFDVFVDTTLKFVLTHTSLDISGDVHIPKATLTPIDFSSTTTMPASHVEYIGLPKKDQPEGGHKINLHLNISLGENVQLKAYGMRANLEGNLVMTMSPQQSTMANGQIRIVDGTFQAYGQYLTITKGSSVSYIESPMTNPFIDARAFKYVNINTENIGSQLGREEIIVGVHIHGTIKQMRFKLYSQPPNIPQADILSYLVLGYANNSGQDSGNVALLADAASAILDSSGGLDRPPGLVDQLKSGLGIRELGVRNETLVDAIGNPIENQSSFVVGDKITENIYIQFSRGLLVPDNILQIQYRFNNNWMLQTTAGVGGDVGTGADVLYTTESD